MEHLSKRIKWFARCAALSECVAMWSPGVDALGDHDQEK